jgi:hypothetical protein
MLTEAGALWSFTDGFIVFPFFFPHGQEPLLVAGCPTVEILSDRSNIFRRGTPPPPP